MNLSEEEQKQYSRHLSLDEIGTQGQLKLKQAKVLVIGAGGLSCPVLQYLAAAGVGTIGIVDDDLVSQSNLQRQILYRLTDVGKPKVECAKRYLEAINPFITIVSHQVRLSSANAIELFQDYDVIVDGTDNFPTRYLCNDAAVMIDKPLVFGSIYKFDGQVSVFNYKNGPTYRCLYPTPPKAGTMPNCAEIGVLGVLPGIIGTLQANEVLKIILELGTVLTGKLLTFDALSMKQMVLSFTKTINTEIVSLAADYESFCGLANNVEELSYPTYKAKADNYNVLDVRTHEERENFHINSLHIPLDQLAEKIHTIPTDKDLLLFCQSGHRSRQAIKILKESSFNRDLLNLKGGLEGVESDL